MNTDPNDLQPCLCFHRVVIHVLLSLILLWGLSICVLTQCVSLTHNALVISGPEWTWSIFLTQQDLEKSHCLREWFPKHWALLVAAGPTAGCLHPCGLGATDRICPPQPLCRLYVWQTFFKEAIPECTKAKKCASDPKLNREMMACSWMEVYAPSCAFPFHAGFQLVFLILEKEKNPLRCVHPISRYVIKEKKYWVFSQFRHSQKQLWNEKEKDSACISTMIFKWGLHLKMTLKMTSYQYDGRHYYQSRSIWTRQWCSFQNSWENLILSVSTYFSIKSEKE